MYRLLVAVGKRPTASLMPEAELAAASEEDAASSADWAELFFAARLPSTPPRTAARITATATGAPIHSHLFFGVDFGCCDLSPADSWSDMTVGSPERFKQG